MGALCQGFDAQWELLKEIKRRTKRLNTCTETERELIMVLSEKAWIVPLGESQNMGNRCVMFLSVGFSCLEDRGLQWFTLNMCVALNQ